MPFANILEIYDLFLNYVYGITMNKFPVFFKLENSPLPLSGFGWIFDVILEGPLNLLQVRKILLQFVGGPSTI